MHIDHTNTHNKKNKRILMPINSNKPKKTHQQRFGKEEDENK